MVLQRAGRAEASSCSSVLRDIGAVRSALDKSTKALNTAQNPQRRYHGSIRIEANDSREIVRQTAKGHLIPRLASRGSYDDSFSAFRHLPVIFAT